MARQGRGAGTRAVQVGEALRQLLAELLIEGALKDPRIAAASMVTVTDVRMTADLRLARILVSVFPEDAQLIRQVFQGFRSADPEIRRFIGDRLKLRFIPELRFELDDSIGHGARIEALLREIAADATQSEAPPEKE